MQGSKAVLCLSIVEALELTRKVKAHHAECYIRLGCVIISTPHCKVYIMPANGSIRHEWSEDHCTDRLAIYAGDYNQTESRYELDLSTGISANAVIKSLTEIIRGYQPKQELKLTRRVKTPLYTAGL